MNAAVIVDAMAMLQSLASPAATFEGLARQIFVMLAKSLLTQGSRVDFVIDRHLVVSIKDSKRFRRQMERGTIRVRILAPAQKLAVQQKTF